MRRAEGRRISRSSQDWMSPTRNGVRYNADDERPRVLHGIERSLQGTLSTDRHLVRHPVPLLEGGVFDGCAAPTELFVRASGPEALERRAGVAQAASEVAYRCHS